MSITLITLTIRNDKNFFFDGRSIRREYLVCQTEFDGQMGNADPIIGGDHYALEGWMFVKTAGCNKENMCFRAGTCTHLMGIILLPSRQKIKDGLLFIIIISTVTNRSTEKP